MAAPPNSSSTTSCMTTYPTPNMTSAQASDWASLPPTLLEKVFRSLELRDLQSAMETCRKWKEQAVASNNARLHGPLVPPPSPAPSMVRSEQWWIDEINTTLQSLRNIPNVPENHELIEIMLQFLVREGIIQEP